MDRFPSLTDVDDIIQEAYLKVLQVYEADTSVMSSPKAFLFATARNRALDLVRRQNRFRHKPLIENDPSFVLSGEEDNETLDRNLEIMTEAIQTLPDRCRQVFTLRKVYGYSHKEIARKLDISVNTVAVQVSIGIRKCKAFMQENRRER